LKPWKKTKKSEPFNPNDELPIEPNLVRAARQVAGEKSR
jgi:hypothetical protein